MHPSAILYFGRESHVALVAPMHVNQDGIGYEQEAVRMLAAGYSTTDLGEALKQALSAFSERRRDLRSQKKSEWPAFRASGLSSVARFEREFLPVVVEYLNASGAVARAEMSLPDQDDIGICCTFNPRLPTEDIGSKFAALLRIYSVAAGAEQKG
jgi:hypothetical protein